jgi:hypothetical protein
MSASTRTVQQTLGIRQMAVALVVVALALALAATVAFGQLAASKPQTAPAAGSAPVFIDHGSRSEIGTAGPRTWGPAPGSYVDKETRDSSSGTSGGSIRLRGQ